MTSRSRRTSLDRPEGRAGRDPSRRNSVVSAVASSSNSGPTVPGRLCRPWKRRRERPADRPQSPGPRCGPVLQSEPHERPRARAGRIRGPRGHGEAAVEPSPARRRGRSDRVGPALRRRHGDPDGPGPLGLARLHGADRWGGFRRPSDVRRPIPAGERGLPRGVHGTDHVPLERSPPGPSLVAVRAGVLGRVRRGSALGGGVAAGRHGPGPFRGER